MGVKKFYVILSVLLFISCAVQGKSENVSQEKINQNLKELDEILNKREEYGNKNQNEIGRARREYKLAQNPEEQYNILRELFNLYRTYKIDSALIIADKRLDAANQIGEYAKVASASLNLADAYAKIGNPDLSIYILDRLDDQSLLPHQLKYKNSIYKTAFGNKADNAMLPRERMEALENLKKYRDREWEEIDKDSRAYLTLHAERLREAGMFQEAVALMEEAERKYGLDDNAYLLYESGVTYLGAGKIDEAIDALSRAAILDLTNGSKEYKSLILLASVLYDKGDIDRSFAYINCALEDATFSKALIRTEEILKIMPGIYKAYSEKEKEIKRRTLWFFIAIGVLNILLFILIGLLIKEHRAKKLMIEEINEINGALKTKNTRLTESDHIKMEHLKTFMLAYAAHIGRLKAFRKNLKRLLNTAQYQKALEKIKLEREEAPDNSAFQEMFDSALLSMFPDFIQQLNRFLKQPMELKADDRLTPELRIAALMKLGINSTQEISEMFQYSSQSVYNLRSSLKGMLKGSWEDFEQGLKDI